MNRKMIQTITITVVTSFVTSILTSIATVLVSRYFARKKERKLKKDKEAGREIKADCIQIQQKRIEDIPLIITNNEVRRTYKQEDQMLLKKEKEEVQNKIKRKDVNKDKDNNNNKTKIIEQTIIAFDPMKEKPESVSYTDLTISDGKLVPCSLGKTSYFRCWEYNGRKFYEFFCQDSLIPKAINNHSSIIDPFCQKDDNSISLDLAKEVTTLEYGEIDNNNMILKKSVIIFK